MKKILFETLNVNITRRCNYKCAHCYMGDAENIDLHPSQIDWMLDRTSRIELLIFLGGEPTLNIEGMNYFLDGLIKRGIPTKAIHILTNGTNDSMAFRDFIVKANAYTSKFSTIEHPVAVAVSIDEYHVSLFESQRNLQKVKKLLSDVCPVFRWSTDVVKLGRAENIKMALDGSYGKKCKVAFYTQEEKDFPCELVKCYQNVDKDEIVIPCRLYLDYKGVFSYCADFSEPVFDFSDTDLVKSLKRFNENKPYCKIKYEIAKNDKDFVHRHHQNRKLQNQRVLPTEDEASKMVQNSAMMQGKYSKNEPISYGETFKRQMDMSTPEEIIEAMRDINPAIDKNYISKISEILLTKRLINAFFLSAIK